MIVSGNELYATALKACTGADFPRGVGEDLSHAAVAMAECGLDTVGMLVRTVELPASDQLQWFFETPNWVCRNGIVSTIGPSLVDFSQLVKDSGYSFATGVRDCGLIYGCALAVSLSSQLSFEIRFDDSELTRSGQWLSVGSDEAVQAIPTMKSNISLRCLGNKENSLASQSIGGLKVDDDDWNKLKKLAERILVQASDKNRADAGAGNTDND